MKIEITSKLSQISLVILVFFLNACSFIEYEEKPLNINEVHQATKQTNLNDPEFILFLKKITLMK